MRYIGRAIIALLIMVLVLISALVEWVRGEPWSLDLPAG